MAGDWIPYCVDLPEQPQVLRLAELLNIPIDQVVGTLLRFWGWVDRHTADGKLPGLTVPMLSRLCPDAVPLFWDKLVEVAWLVAGQDAGHDFLLIPGFDLWFGRSAKRRLMEARKKRRQRHKPTETARKSPPGPEANGTASGQHRDSIGTPGGTTAQDSTEQHRTEENQEPLTEVCAEPAEDSRSAPAVSPVVLVFPAKGKGAKSWTLTQVKLEEYRQTYPDFDVLAECRKAWQWCVDNPTKQKTARGLPSFLTRWLNNRQNHAPRFSQSDAATGPARLDTAISPEQLAQERQQAEVQAQTARTFSQERGTFFPK